LVFLTARIYLGMHSLTDVIAGIGFGIIILAFWLVVHDHVDAFVVSGQNGMSIHLKHCQSFVAHKMWH
jgi:membrane-associated phospholipid phosphatase